MSQVVLNLADAAARRDIANPYEMHSTLMRLVDAGSSRPLWRLERSRDRERPPVVLIQTEDVPEASALSGASQDYFIHFSSRHNRLLESLRSGDQLNFRLRANPTVTRERKRHGLERVEDQLSWLERQIEGAGGRLVGAQTSNSGKVRFIRRGSDRRIVLLGVTYDGRLEVTDAQALREAVKFGLGPGKALGFGLLTLAR